MKNRKPSFLYIGILATALTIWGMVSSAKASTQPYITDHQINFGTGNKYLTTTDVGISGPGMSVSFTRTYNSHDNSTSIMGYGWSTQLTEKLTFVEGAIHLAQKDGRVVYFTDNGEGIYINETGRVRTITSNSEGYLLTEPNGTTKQFDNIGKLLKTTRLDNNVLSYSYTGEQLDAISTNFGQSLAFTYQSGKLSQVVAPTGTVGFSYDENDNLVTVTNPDNTTITYVYEDANDLHNLTGVINEDNTRIRNIAYDEDDRVVSSSFQNGTKAVTISYPSTLTRIITDSLGATTTYELEITHGIVQVKSFTGPGCSSCGSDTGSEYTYNSRFQVTERTNARGYITSYTYDDLGNKLTETRAVGEPEEHTIVYTYDETVNKVRTKTEQSIANPEQSKVTTYGYDVNGNMLTRTVAGYSGTSSQSATTSYSYDNFGRITTIDGPRTDVDDIVSMTYYPNEETEGLNRGFLHTVTNALGHTTTYTDYNGFGKAETITDPNGIVTTRTFDSRGRLTSRTTQTRTTTYAYNASGKVQSMILPGNREIGYSYDSEGYLAKITDNLGNSITYTYDRQGRKTGQSIHDPEGTLTAFVNYDYDDNGRLHKIINPDETEKILSYDAVGNLVNRTNENTIATEFVYDPLNRLTSTIEAGTVNTTYFYNAHGNQTEVIDGEGRATQFTYDDFGNRLTRTSPDSGLTTYTFDIAGNLLSKTDANLITINYGYDALNRLVSVDYPDSGLNVNYSYDEGENGKGRLTGVEDAVSVTFYSYNAFGSLTSEEKNVGGVVFTTGYSYNNNGELIAITYPSGRTVTYDRDIVGNVTTVSSTSNGETVMVADNITALPFGPTSDMSLGNGLALSSSYDEMYRLTNTHIAELYDRTYNYQATGQVKSIIDNLQSANSQQFGYDNLGRLTSGSGSYGSLAFSYDNVGNRLTATQGEITDMYDYYSGTNRLAAITSSDATTAYTYDEVGNSLTRGDQQYSWNQDNRLEAVTSGTETVGQYGYDAQGLRVIKTEDDYATFFVYDASGNLLAETTEQGQTIREYAYLNGQRLTLFDYTMQPQFNLAVLSSTGSPVTGVKAYAFDESSRYAGIYGQTDENGEALYDRGSFGEGVYIFRIDYLGAQYWSEAVSVQDENGLTVVIEEEPVEVTVEMAGQLQEGVKVYVFAENGNYMGVYGVTDAEGKVSFTLPESESYTFRADLFGGKFWSSATTVADGGSATTIDTGGGQLQFFVGKEAADALPGITTYLFSETGRYLGKKATSDAEGEVTYTVPDGNFKIRADYLGYKYWSDLHIASELTNDFIIPHRTVAVGVTAKYGENVSPLSEVPCYLFTPAGAYQGVKLLTDETGHAFVELPEQPYRFRADYFQTKYWSDDVIWQDAEVNIEHGKALVEVTKLDQPLSNVPVYVFNESGQYLGLQGMTEETAIAFDLPAGAYTFRADYLGNRYWGEALSLVAHEENPVRISTGGGSFTLSLTDQNATPLENVRIYAFNESGSYLGEYANTNDLGEVAFNLSDGSYTFRADYLGYKHWTDPVSIPETLASTLVIEHTPVTITALTRYLNEDLPLANAKAYLFSSADQYMGMYKTTGEDGSVTFDLPAKEYKVRVDYFGGKYFSDTFSGSDTQIIIPEGLARVLLQSGENTLADVPVYVFNESGSYMGLNGRTDSNGSITFALPEENYKFRGDYLTSQYWAAGTVVADQSQDFLLQTGGTPLSFTIKKGEAGILADVPCYLFNGSGNYLGLMSDSDASGLVAFDVSDGSYKLRVDYLKSQYWSTMVTTPEITSATVTIPHNDVTVSVLKKTVAGTEPLPGIHSYLFSNDGGYTGLNKVSDAQGIVHFNVPEAGFTVRADYLQQHYWSEEFTWQNAQIEIAHGDITLSVLQSGAPVSGANVYLFNESGNYLGIKTETDASGNAKFSVPAGSYQLRVDLDGNQYWTELINVIALENNQLEFSLDQLTLNSTANPHPTRQDGEPPVFMPLLAANAAISGVLSESSATMIIGAEARAYWYISDHLGTAQLLTDAAGKVVWQGEFTPFGKVTIVDDELENHFRFPGQYYDSETRLHYNWHRFYDPETGRYISADPIGLDGGMNLYAYVKGDPINVFDPLGLCPNNQCDKWTITIVAAGSASTDKFKWRKGIAALAIKAQLKADSECCMDVKEREYHFQGLGLGVGGDISGSLDTGGGKCFKTACISWEAHEGMGRATSAGIGGGNQYWGTLWVTTPQAYLNFSGKGLGFGASAETTIGRWTLGQDISAK